MFKIVDDHENDGFEGLDLLLGAEVYFEGRTPNGSKGAEISSIIKIMNTRHTTNQLMYLEQDPMIYINRKDLGSGDFNTLLKLYENNQLILSRTLDDPETLTQLINLECWFLRVIEPRPQRGNLSYADWISEIDEWKVREKTKLNGYTSYCLDSIGKKIKRKIPSHVLIQIKTNLASIKENG